jgi:hypothetical protein
MSGDWSIVFYLEDSGDSPVEEFLSGLDAKTRARFGWSQDRAVARLPEEDTKKRPVKKLPLLCSGCNTLLSGKEVKPNDGRAKAKLHF